MRRRRLCGLVGPWAMLVALGFVFPAPLDAQGVDYVKQHYSKQEPMIAMRDGVKLFTSIYVPKDTSRKYPILLMRTPYGVGPYGADAYRGNVGPSTHFCKEGYIVAYQDVRGLGHSEGQFVNMRPHLDRKEKPTDIDESTDTYDTIDWLVKNIPNNNGRVGMWGISYPGFYVDAGMIDAHPALKAASPQAPVTDWFAGDDWHHNGALFLPHAFNFLASFGRPRAEPGQSRASRFRPGTPDGYEFFLRMGPLANVNRRYLKDGIPFWNEMMQHGTYDDFWQARDIRRHLRKIRPAVMTVGGWYDAENLFGALETYKNVEASSPGITNMVVMGPWRHGGWSFGDGSSLAHVPFHAKTAEYYREKIEFPFFQHFLKDQGSPKFPEAWVFETGSNRWREFETWPPKSVRPRSIFLQPGGKLGFDPPAPVASGPQQRLYDEYISDPAHPVEYTEEIAFGMLGDYMIRDQRVASRRPDVVVYEGEPLKEDITVAGPIQARLFVSTSGTDSDWIIKLIDVFPDNAGGDDGPNAPVKLGGYQELVRGDVMRGKFRNSLSKPEPFVPGQPTPVNFRLQDVSHTFQKGHKIMVQIQSTWFPLVDRNPQKFVDINNATEADFHKATQRVYHEASMPSRLEVLTIAE
ncbi:MAG: CocE/NonD family hydrolase [Isosphaeraceae bacterium]